MRKWVLVLAGVVLAAAVVVPAALRVHAYRQKLTRGRLIDQDHCDRIKAGMSHAEVEAILGGPPGVFTTEQGVIYSSTSWISFGGDGTLWEDWSANGGLIEVAFNRGGRVQYSQFASGTVLRLPPPSVSERVRAWLWRLWP